MVTTNGATGSFPQIMVEASCKTEAVRPLTANLTNHPSKTNALEKEVCSPVESYV